MSLSVLVIGGSGAISTACVAQAASKGFAVSVVNRGFSENNGRTPAPASVERLRADVDQPGSLAEALTGRTFDVVVNFRAFGPAEVTRDLELFEGRVGQYVFISSASAYQTPPARLPITEATPLRNPFWQYARDKIAAEDVLVQAYRERGFPATIVRPSHTYDPTSVPLAGRWTVIDRMRRGRPVVVHGDGTSLWTLTHHTDFARAFVALLGRPDAAGRAFHITSDEALTWDAIYRELGRAAGVEPQLVHVPTDAINALDPVWGTGLLGDKSHSMVFDNSLIKAFAPGWQAVVPFSRGAREIVAWFDADPARKTVDAQANAQFDTLVDRFGVHTPR